jgi:WD40 repeat protein
MTKFRRWDGVVLCVSAIYLPIVAARAAAPVATRGDEVTFWRDVAPVFQRHCTICHSTKNIDKKEIGGGLALTTFDAVTKSPKEPIVAPGKAGESKLLQRLTTADEDKRMPLDAEPLAPELIDIVRRWIDAGAKEGERPAQPDEPGAAAAAIKRPASPVRTRDVVIESTTILTAESARAIDATATAGRLDLTLKVGPLPPIAALAYSPDGKLLAAGGYGSVAIWDMAEARVSRSIEFSGAVHAVAFNTDGTKLAVAGGLPARNGLVTLFDTATWQAVATLAEHTDVVYDVAFSPDGKKLATAGLDKTARVWDASSLKPEASILTSVATLKGHADSVYSVAFTPDAKRLVSCGKDRSIKTFKTETWELERTISGHNEEVLAIAVSPDSKHVVSAGKEPQLRWWTLEEGQDVRRVAGHKGTVSALIFSRDGKRVASAGQDGTLRIWDGSSGEQIHQIAGGAESLYSVAFSPDGRFVAAAGWDGLVRVWATEAARPLATLIAPPSSDPAKPHWIALGPEGRYDASDDLAAVVRWRIEGKTLSGDMLTSLMRQPEVVRKSLRGEAIEPVRFP